jgi:transcriptional regulator with XRE-family HTH domain
MAQDLQDPREIQFREELASRLSLAVEAISAREGLTKGEIAKAIGVPQNRLSNWTTNQNAPSWFHIFRLCKRFRISADWILLGELDGVPRALADYLEAALVDKSAASEAQAAPQHESQERAKAVKRASDVRPPKS